MIITIITLRSPTKNNAENASVSVPDAAGTSTHHFIDLLYFSLGHIITEEHHTRLQNSIAARALGDAIAVVGV